MSLFDQAPRSASVQAETTALLLCLDRASLHQFIEISPRAAAAFFFQMVQVFTARLRESGNLVAEVTRWGLEATGLDFETKPSR
jgi:CRP-like cAMP-binding protein